MVINFTFAFLLRGLPFDTLDLDDIPLDSAPELALFRFQEFLDFVMDEADFQKIELLIKEMHGIDRQREFGSELQLRGLLLQLLGLVSHRYQAELNELVTNKAERRVHHSSIQRVLRHIRTNIADPDLNLTDTAAAACLSPGYLSNLLNKTLGKSFSELVLGRRMRMACSRLLNSTESIAEIARECGYTDNAYFSRRFRQQLGIPPGQYRREKTK